MTREPSHEIQPEQLGRRIAARRKLSGLSQADAARRAGLDPSYLSRLENGRIHPTVRTATRLAAALQVSLNDLLAEQPAGRPDRPCPVNPKGRCLLDALASSAPSAAPEADAMSPRQLRLLRQVTGLLQEGGNDALAALEVVVRALRASA